PSEPSPSVRSEMISEFCVTSTSRISMNYPAKKSILSQRPSRLTFTSGRKRRTEIGDRTSDIRLFTSSFFLFTLLGRFKLHPHRRHTDLARHETGIGIGDVHALPVFFRQQDCAGHFFE